MIEIFEEEFNLKNKKSPKGFTLMELMVVFAIIGVLAAIAIPAFRMFNPTLQLSGAARNLASDFRYAQQLAVTDQVEHGVRFFINEKKYQIVKLAAGEEVLKSTQLPDGIIFLEISGFTGNEAKFNPYGAVQESGLVVLENSKNATTTIEVKPSGFVKIFK